MMGVTGMDHAELWGLQGSHRLLRLAGNRAVTQVGIAGDGHL